MKAKIEDYRGWEISFDIEEEKFYAQTQEWDKEVEKNSFASAKKYIDDFLKENNRFEPIWVETRASVYGGAKKVKLIGLRLDGRFVYEGKDGEKEQLSEYTEKDYMLDNPVNEPIFIKIQESKDKIECIRGEISELEKQVTIVGIKEIKDKYLK